MRFIGRSTRSARVEKRLSGKAASQDIEANCSAASREESSLLMALAEINGGIAQIVQSLGTLKFLRRDVSSALRVALDETRCWANVEVIEALLQREIEEWGQYGRRRRHWQKRFEDPDDCSKSRARRSHARRNDERSVLADCFRIRRDTFPTRSTIGST